MFLPTWPLKSLDLGEKALYLESDDHLSLSPQPTTKHIELCLAHFYNPHSQHDKIVVKINANDISRGPWRVILF